MKTDDYLYREELMEVYKNNKNKGTLTEPSVEVFEKNPMCGDEITLQLKVEDGVIQDARYDGSACAVSVISSNYLLDFLKGKTLEEARNLTKEEFLNLINLNLTTSRVKCATLVLDGLIHALQKYEEKNRK